MALSPMMRQYMEIKEQNKECILFFRLGDFYEMFFDDAITVSKELELTLTGKQCGLEEKAPMCGVPFHSAETYISRLVEKGYKIAICEQMEDPATVKGLVKRDVVQIVTPGTVISQNMLDERENNYLSSVYCSGKDIGLSYCDVSTGELYVTELAGSDRERILTDELVKIKTSEIIINDENSLDIDDLKNNTEAYFNVLNENYYGANSTKDAILRQFHVGALLGLGINEESPIVYSLGAMLLYLQETQKNNLDHIRIVNTYDVSNHMSLDRSTIKNLEITETLFEKKVQGSLLGVLDKTHTAMGSRKMKQWLREPLNNVEDICLRLDAVEELTEDQLLRNNIKESLKKIYDFERLAGRIACGTANGKDLIALRNSCYVLPEIKNDLAQCQSHMLKVLQREIDPLSEIYQLIDKAVVEEPPFTIKEGGVIKDGYNDQLDHLKNSIKDATDWIARLENKERERTGIKKLKVGFNKVFGYYIEITKSNYDMIPENYIRKQTLANAERFITPELKEMEGLVLNAESKINKLEYDLFLELRIKIQGFIREIQSTSSAISQLDVLTAFSHVSARMDYVKPQINCSDEVKIQKGRHPVIEQTIKDGIFVSNDLFIDKKDASMLLITGPNMSGKSTYMRQNALIVLMAQAGCFVPCESASIGIADRIFTRIGASDNLAQGQSTFFVEMSEMSYILNSATEKSLIILDEIGRGTSTYDGLSIAWALVEYLCGPKRKIRTLFATHYHELTALENNIKGVKNLNVDVSEENGDVVFLHKIVQGSASRSYGIHVAKLAGAPRSLLERATEKLDELENPQPVHLDKRSSVEDGSVSSVEEEQISFFGFAPDPVAERLRNLDLMKITPSEAFKILEDLKAAAEK